MRQLTSSEHGEHGRKLNALFRSVSGTPSRDFIDLAGVEEQGAGLIGLADAVGHKDRFERSRGKKKEVLERDANVFVAPRYTISSTDRLASCAMAPFSSVRCRQKPCYATQTIPPGFSRIAKAQGTPASPIFSAISCRFECGLPY
jgi:hypothetical protein